MPRGLTAVLSTVLLLLFAAEGSAQVVADEADLGDFGDDFATRTVLAPGILNVRGSTIFGNFCDADCDDWFTFTGLTAGQPFELILESIFGDAGTVFRLYDGAGVQIGPNSGAALFDQTVVTGTVPAGGALTVRNTVGQDSSVYSVTLVESPRPDDIAFFDGSIVRLDTTAGEAYAMRTFIQGPGGITSGSNGDLVYLEQETTELHIVRGAGDTVDTFDPGEEAGVMALAPDGNLFYTASSPAPGVYRWRPGVGDPALLSAGTADALAVAPTGELFALDAGVVEQIDRTTGARTAISSGGLIGSPLDLAAESAGSLIVIDDASGVVRIDVGTAAQSVVSAGPLVGSAQSVAIATDGTIVVGTRESGPGVEDAEIVLVDPVSGVQSLQAIDMAEIDTIFEIESVRCTDAGGACAAVPQCSVDADCNDGTFCNGPETCNAGVCESATTDACLPDEFCDEGADACVECLVDADCDDGVFCNGSEVCDVSGTCQAGGDPCPGQFCDEGGAVCVAIGQDFDIMSVRATSRVRLSTGAASEAKVTIKNQGAAADVAELTVSAVHDGNEIFGITQLVQQQASNGRAVLEFSATPTVVADVIWTATIVDADPDVDTDSDTTTVVP